MSNRERRLASQVIRGISAPLRALGRARNHYVRRMNSLANLNSCSVDGRDSFSSCRRSSGEEDFRELVRVSSQSRVAAAGEAVRRSRSVAVGRIDEDAPCDFSGEVWVGESLIFPRSRTCGAAAAGKMRV